MKLFDKASFRAAVYDLIRLIPYGRATSYGAIAKAVGYPNMSRMVGQVLHNCPNDIPAHRVVNSQGVLSGKNSFKDPLEMENLLKDEHILIHQDRISEWHKIFWDPTKELTFN